MLIGQEAQNYAIIYEHAVYALLTAMDLSSGTGSLAQASAPGKFDRLVIEVEGYKWLGLCWTDDDNGRLLGLYDMANHRAFVVGGSGIDRPAGFDRLAGSQRWRV